MVFLYSNSDFGSDNDVVYRGQNIETPFSLVITDEYTPIVLLEGVEFRHPLTSEKPKQTSSGLSRTAQSLHSRVHRSM